MKIVPITDEMLNRAKDHYSFTALKNSITKGTGNFIGALGEIGVLNDLEGSKLIGSFDYDVEYKGLRIEVKTKKQE